MIDANSRIDRNVKNRSFSLPKIAIKSIKKTAVKQVLEPVTIPSKEAEAPSSR